MRIIGMFLFACLLGGIPLVAAGQGLSKAELQRLELDALRGSGDAARRVSLYHGTADEKLMEYWSWIGAENGDPICQYNYASILRGRADRYSRIRAIYWMRKAARAGARFAPEDLKNMLKEIENK